jgi:PBS lyase HEAT-like repeat
MNKVEVRTPNSTYDAATDRGIQARIIQALAQIGDRQAIALLEKVVGVSVANHSQGNVRRIAARGLGKISSTAVDTQTIHRAVKQAQLGIAVTGRLGTTLCCCRIFDRNRHARGDRYFATGSSSRIRPRSSSSNSQGAA